MKKHKFIKIGVKYIKSKKHKYSYLYPTFSKKYDKRYILKCRICNMEINTDNMKFRVLNDWRDDCDLVIASEIYES
jgi:hypothetical protein